MPPALQNLPAVSWARGAGWRDRLLANPSFRRWAARFPLTRPIVRRRTRELFDICAGFVYSQVLYACVQARLFDLLSAGPRSVVDLAAATALPAGQAERMFEAAISLRLLERRRGALIGLGPLGVALVGNPAIVAMIEHHTLLYEDLRDPLALLRGRAATTWLRRYWAYAGNHDAANVAVGDVAEYSSLMALSQSFIADEVLDAYPMRDHACLLDIGGGEGAFALAAASRNPGLRVVLFDLPAVAARARDRFMHAGLGARGVAVGGDFRAESLPEGADLISLVRVVHDHDDEQVAALFVAARRVIRPGGRLLLAEPLAETPGAEPVGAAYFGFYLLAMGSGRPRTAQQLFRMLENAGFRRPRLLSNATPLLTRIIVSEC